MHLNSRIKVAFKEGDLTSDSVLLLVKEFNEKVGFHDLIRSVQMKDPVNHTEHTNDAVIIKRTINILPMIMSIVSGLILL